MSTPLSLFSTSASSNILGTHSRLRVSPLLVQGLLCVSVTAARGRRVRRETVVTDPGIASDCTFWDIVGDKSQNCAYFEDLYGLEHKVFVEYNPSVKDDCSGIQEGHSYCLEVNHGLPRDDNPQSKPSSPSKPSIIQEGLIKSCTSFHQASKGEIYAKIISTYGTFDFNTFFKWNPAVGKDCSGIWASYYYCVGVPGTPTAKPSATSPKPTATGGVQIPSPIQEGITKNCNKFHQITKKTTCSSIENYYKLPLSLFLT
ncbi:LysM domain superfamily [Fusarium oxysporum f. sp. vasinfectum]|nr:LysM domain superfamily [Fusarium oxysporum f. sp. vasinfectum]